MDDPQITPQIVKSQSGGELVVLNRSEYDTLIEAFADAQEELADIAILDQRLGVNAASAVPPLPAGIAQLLLQGKRRRAALRTWRNLSEAELAHRAQVTVEVLSSFERGAGTPDTDVTQRNARALDVPTAWFVP